jgi:flagellar basal-body rod modification protein FlgD
MTMPAAIPGISNAPDIAPTTADPIGKSNLGKDDFLKLLMAQMANQDPTAPTDNGQFVAQLAQFSSLEAAQGTNTRLDTLLLAQANNTQTQYVNFIGKDVEYKTESLDHQQGLATVSQGTLAGNAATVTATILDSSGHVVRTLNLGAQDAGPIQIIWDGKNDSGTPQPGGTYTMKVVATDSSGASVATDLHSKGAVTGVTYTNGIPQLSVNGTQIKMSDITSISERSTQ